MAVNLKTLKKSLSSNIHDKIMKYIHQTESIKEIIKNKKSYISNLFYTNENNNKRRLNNNNCNAKKNVNQFKKSDTNFFKNNKLMLKSFSDNELFLPNNHHTINNTIKKRPFSNELRPCRAFTINKERGYNSILTIIQKGKKKNNFFKKYIYIYFKNKKEKIKIR